MCIWALAMTLVTHVLDQAQISVFDVDQTPTGKVAVVRVSGIGQALIVRRI
jgi:hypothetical protein